MRKFIFIAVTALAMAATSIAPARAGDPVSAAPSIVETVDGSAKVLLTCAAGQMPVLTEGPTVEIQAGKEIRHDQGILKCVGLAGPAGTVEAGGSASLSFTDGRKLEVRDCPKGTVPFVLGFEHLDAITRDPAKPLPAGYFAMGRVTVRCMEPALMGAPA